MIEGRMLINGQMTESESGRWIPCINPATEEEIGRIPRASEKDAEAAIQAAQEAFPAWKMLSIDQRGAYLNRLADRIAECAEEIAAIECMDTGHTLKRVKGDVASASYFLRFYAGLGWELKGEVIPATTPNNLHFTVREPYGVVAKIVPFNHPVMFASRIGAPLIAGNTIILKAPKEASLSICKFAELCQEIFPPGVVTILTGNGSEVGDYIVKHPKIKRIGFIGSEETGINIQRAAADTTVKQLTLELGGKNPMIVYPDADVEKAIRSVPGGMSFAWSSQSCGSLTRLFLHDSIYDQGLELLKELVDAFVVGDPTSDETNMGPIIYKQQYEKVLYYIQAGKEDGARLISGGCKPEGPGFEKGYWVRPTVFADVTPDMRIFKEEVFGPVLSVIRWSDEEEMIRLANSLNLGLTGSIWTQNINTALRTAERLETGYIWINSVSAHYKAVPFGGKKNSGIGREEGLDEIMGYTESKTISIICD